MKDVEPGVPDEVIEEAGDIDAMTLKKASGGIARMIGEQMDIENILFMYEDDYNPGPRPMAQGGRIPFAEAKSVQKIKSKNKGTTKSFYDESTGHIYPRKNRFGTFYSDTPAGGDRRNIIPENIGKKIL